MQREIKNSKNMKKLSVTLLITVLLAACVTPTICIVKLIKFKQECAGYLKQAADANTVDIAIDRLDKALSYIETHNLTNGYTSVVYKTEDENIGFWYTNIKACKQELEKCMESSQLEQTNVLMKVRESLTDTDQDGTVLTIPSGIYKYPDNTKFAIANTISILVMIGCFVMLYIILDNPHLFHKYN